MKFLLSCMSAAGFAKTAIVHGSQSDMPAGALCREFSPNLRALTLEAAALEKKGCVFFPTRPRPRSGDHREPSYLIRRSAASQWQHLHRFRAFHCPLDLDQRLPSYEQRLLETARKRLQNRREAMMKSIAVVFALTLASSVQAMPRAPLQQPDDIVIKVREACGAGMHRVNGVCIATPTRPQVCGWSNLLRAGAARSRK